MPKKDITLPDGTVIPFNPDDRYQISISFQRLPREGEDQDNEDVGKDKGMYQSGPLDFGAFVGVQGLTVNLLKEMHGWGKQMAKVVGIPVPQNTA